MSCSIQIRKLVLFLSLATVLSACGGGGSDPFDSIRNDPNNINNLYDRNANLCGHITTDGSGHPSGEGAMPGCTYRYDGSKIDRTLDPYYWAGNGSDWTTTQEVRYHTVCNTDPETGDEICEDQPYTVTFLLSRSGIKYDTDTNRAVNANKQLTVDGFVAAHKDGAKKIRQMGALFASEYGMDSKLAHSVAAQMLVNQQTQGTSVEQDALVDTITAAVPSLSRTSTAQAMTAYIQTRNSSPAKQLLNNVQSKAGMTRANTQRFLSEQMGVNINL